MMWYRAQPAALRFILTVNVVIYLLWQIILVHIRPANAFVWQNLALNPSWPGILAQPWQLITYNFLHLGFGFWGLIHIAFNMLWLVWVGREYEQTHGSHRLFALFMLSGLGGGLLTVLLFAIFPMVPGFGGIVHGASGGVFGVMMGIAIMYPHQSIALLFFGVVRLIHVVLVLLALNLLFLGGGNTAVAAHFGGALFGFLYVKIEDRGLDMAAWAKVFFPQQQYGRSGRGSGGGGVRSWFARRREKPVATEPRTARIHTLRRDDEPVEEDPLSVRIDRILDKINEEGEHSLTDEERRILLDASKR
jgi:membrane associated rhomboid family serine protease